VKANKIAPVPGRSDLVGNWCRFPRPGSRAMLAVAVGSALMIASACSSSSPSASSSGGSNGAIQLTVGFPDDLSGFNVGVGKEQLEAAQLAVKDVHSAHPNVHIKLIPKDTQSVPSAAASAIQSLTANSSVNAIVGMAFTGSAEAVSPLLTRSGLPTIYLQVTDLTGAGSNIVSMGAPGQNMLQLLTKQILQPKGYKRVAFIWQQVDTFVSAVNYLKTSTAAAGLKVVASQGGSETQTDFSSQVTNVLASKPDAIVVEALTPQTATIADDLRSSGYKGAIIGYQNIGEPAFRQAAGAATAGVMYTTYWDPAVANADAQRFITAFKTAYPSQPPPDVFGMQAWDAIHILAAAALHAHSTAKDKLIAALHSMTFPAGAQTTIKFGSDPAFAVLHGYVMQYTSTSAKKLAG
jgi:branched-chain amino acid transport system substrate-binding protein